MRREDALGEVDMGAVSELLPLLEVESIEDPRGRPRVVESLVMVVI